MQITATGRLLPSPMPPFHALPVPLTPEQRAMTKSLKQALGVSHPAAVFSDMDFSALELRMLGGAPFDTSRIHEAYEGQGPAIDDADLYAYCMSDVRFVEQLHQQARDLRANAELIRRRTPGRLTNLVFALREIYGTPEVKSLSATVLAPRRH